LLPQTPHELVAAIQSFNAPGALADMVAGFMDIKPEEKQGILETSMSSSGSTKVLALLAHRIAVMRLSRNRYAHQEKVDERQREYILREQLKQIQKELGDDTETAELEELEQLIAKAKMPRRSSSRPARSCVGSSGCRTHRWNIPWCAHYLEWLTEPALERHGREGHRLGRGEENPRRGPFGLEKVKRRIVEYLAVRKLNPSGKAPIFCFVGLPGSARLRSDNRSRGCSVQIRAGRTRRRARRGRDPRAPAHLRRLSARQYHPGAEKGGCARRGHVAR